MIKKIIFAGLIFGASLFASDCKYSIDRDSFDFKWTAFKYDTKAGVSGTFDSYELEFRESNSLERLLKSAEIEIDSKSVNTAHKERDATLFKSFFSLFSEDEIEVEVKSAMVGDKIGTLNLEIEMNSREFQTPMNYKIENSKLTAIGTIDMLYFGLSDALSSINRACYDLHKGVTWSQVDLEFSFKLKKSCN